MRAESMRDMRAMNSLMWLCLFHGFDELSELIRLERHLIAVIMKDSFLLIYINQKTIIELGFSK